MKLRSLQIVGISAALFSQDTAKLDPVRTEITINEKISAEAPAFITVLNKLQVQAIPPVVD